jgi:hypothetical protein
MKILNLVFMIFAGCLVVVLSHCSKDNPSPAEEKKITELLTSGAWKIQSVHIDGVPHDELFEDLNLTFTATGFTATNGDAVWPSSGTWDFTDKTATSFTRNDGIEVVIEEITDSRLVLSLMWAETLLGGGRVKSIEGENVFEFGK